MELLRGFPQRAVLFFFPIFQNQLLASAGFQAPAFLNQIAEFKPSPQHFPVVCPYFHIIKWGVVGGEGDPASWASRMAQWIKGLVPKPF